MKNGCQARSEEVAYVSRAKYLLMRAVWSLVETKEQDTLQ